MINKVKQTAPKNQSFDKNIFEQVKNKNKFESIQEKAAEVMQPKPYALEYFFLFVLLKYSSPIFSLFSIATACSYLYYKLASNLHPAAAAIFAFILLALLESIKLFTAHTATRQSYQARRPAVLLLFVLPLFAASVFLSLQGVKELYLRLNTEIEVITSDFSIKRDSINNYFAAQSKVILEEKSEARRLKDWRNGDKIADILTALQARQDTLEQEKKTALHKIESLQNTQSQAAEEKANFDSLFWIIVAATNETIILVSIWFVIHYYHMTDQEKKLISKITNQSFKTNLHELENFLNSFFLMPQAQPSPQQSQPYKVAAPPAHVGFQINQPNQEPTPAQPYKVEEDVFFKMVINDYKAGLSEREIADKHNSKRNQIRKILIRNGILKPSTREAKTKTLFD